MRKLLLLPALLVALTLAGCNEPDAASIAAICKALVGPLRYTSENKASFRYAGKTLVLDLKQRNQIWDRLGCRS